MKNMGLVSLTLAGVMFLALAVPRAAVAEGEAVELTAKYVKGEKWCTLSELASTATVTRLDRNGAVTEKQVATKRVDTIEFVFDSVDETGKLTGMTLDVLRSSVTVSHDGKTAEEMKTPFHGRKVVVTAGLAMRAVFANGAREPVAAEDFTPCAEFQWLLPAKPVAKGDTWEPTAPALVNFLLNGFEPKEPTVKATCRLEDVVSRDNSQVAVITVALSAKTGEDSDFSWEYELTSGKFEFNITSGRPMRLELVGKGKMAWRQLDAQKQEIASYTAVIESAGLKVSFGTSDFVLPPKKEPE